MRRGERRGGVKRFWVVGLWMWVGVCGLVGAGCTSVQLAPARDVEVTAAGGEGGGSESVEYGGLKIWIAGISGTSRHAGILYVIENRGTKTACMSPTDLMYGAIRAKVQEESGQPLWLFKPLNFQGCILYSREKTLTLAPGERREIVEYGNNEGRVSDAAMEMLGRATRVVLEIELRDGMGEFEKVKLRTVMKTGRS